MTTRTPASGKPVRHAGVVGDRDDAEAGDRDADDLGDKEQRSSDRHARAALADHAAQRADGVETRDDGRNDPTRTGREVVVGEIVDQVVLDHDHAFDLEHLQDDSLPDQEPCERDDERRDADLGHDRALGAADERAQSHRDRDRDDSGIRMAATRELELGDGQSRYPAQIPDRKVDLAEEEDEDHSEGEHGQAGHLDDDVVEVVRGEEVRRLEAEEDDDERQADDDRQDPEVARPHVVVDPAPEPCLRLGFVSFGETDPRCRDVDFRAHDASSGAVAGMPATLVGIPAVIACTTSCCVVFSRS